MTDHIPAAATGLPSAHLSEIHDMLVLELDATETDSTHAPGHGEAMPNISRRSLFYAAPALVFAGSCAASVATDPHHAIRHHITQAVRLLRETAPDGFEVRNLHWTASFGPDAPEDLCAYARGDVAQDYGQAMYRPFMRHDWWVLQPPMIARSV